MGEKALVEGLINDSVNLVRNLDTSNAAPTFVAWYFYEDADEWRLLIAGPEFDHLLPKTKLWRTKRFQRQFLQQTCSRYRFPSSS